MSQLSGLKSQIEALAAQAQRISGQLSQFRSTFGQASNQVQATIGGSSQGRDRELLASIQQAQRQVDQAAAAMIDVQRRASQYGASL